MDLSKIYQAIVHGKKDDLDGSNRYWEGVEKIEGFSMDRNCYWEGVEKTEGFSMDWNCYQDANETKTKNLDGSGICQATIEKNSRISMDQKSIEMLSSRQRT